jgi:hypothetical protein
MDSRQGGLWLLLLVLLMEMVMEELKGKAAGTTTSIGSRTPSSTRRRSRGVASRTAAAGGIRPLVDGDLDDHGNGDCDCDHGDFMVFERHALQACTGGRHRYYKLLNVDAASIVKILASDPAWLEILLAGFLLGPSRKCALRVK